MQVEGLAVVFNLTPCFEGLWAPARGLWRV